MMCASELYTELLINLKEIVEEKKIVVGEMLEIITAFNMQFANNKNYQQALDYFNENVGYYLQEIDEEHKVYEALFAYFKTFCFITDLTDTTLRCQIESTFDILNESFAERSIAYTFFMSHYRNIIEQGILTNKNYLYSPYKEHIPEDSKEYVLELLNKIK